MEHYLDNLLRRATKHWQEGNPVPMDLAAEMLEAGLDVETLERKYRA